MKKGFIVFALIVSLFFAQAFAQEIPTQQPTGVIPEPVVQIETTQEASQKVQFNYYYSPTCIWCQKLDKFLEKNNAYETLDINKIDVRYRGEEMVKAAEEHGLNPAGVGTPFVTFGPNGTGSVVDGGYYGALNVFAEQLGVAPELQSDTEKKSQSLIIIILGLLIIVGPLAYLGLKK